MVPIYFFLGVSVPLAMAVDATVCTYDGEWVTGAIGDEADMALDQVYTTGFMAEDSINKCIGDAVSGSYDGFIAKPDVSNTMRCIFFNSADFHEQATLDLLPRLDRPEKLGAQTGTVSYMLKPLQGLWLDGQIGIYQNRMHSELMRAPFMSDKGQADCIFRAKERGAGGFYARNQDGDQACWFFYTDKMRDIDIISQFTVLSEADLNARTTVTSYILPDPGCVATEYAVVLADSRLAEDECESDLVASDDSLSTCAAEKTQLSTDLDTCTATATTCTADKDACTGSLQTCETDKASSDSKLTACQVLSSDLQTAFDQCEANNVVLEQSVADTSAQLTTCTSSLLESADDHDACTASLKSCSTTSATCTQNLLKQTADHDQCLTDKASVATTLAQCNTDLATETTSNAKLTSSLQKCESEKDTLQLSLTAANTATAKCEATLSKTQSSLGTCNTDLDSCQAESASCRDAMAQRDDLLNEVEEWGDRTDAWIVKEDELNTNIATLEGQLAAAAAQTTACECAESAVAEGVAPGCNAASRREKMGPKARICYVKDHVNCPYALDSLLYPTQGFVVCGRTTDNVATEEPPVSDQPPVVDEGETGPNPV